MRGSRKKPTPIRLQKPVNSSAPYLGVTAMRDAFERAGLSVRGRIGTWATTGWKVLRASKPKRRKRNARKRVQADA